MARFAGKVFLISGGARGLGAAQARQLVAQGAKVVVGDLLEDAGQALAAELGPAAVFQRLDVTDATQWRTAVEAAERLGPLNGLVNNAGIFQPAPILEVDTAMFERHWRVNELGTFLGMQAAVPAFVRTGGGSIVNISSSAGLRGVPNAIHYTANKFAVRGMTKAAAIELADRNIRVNSVHPGMVDTELLKIRPAELNLAFAQTQPIKRLATPDEIAGPVLFLLSDESRYMTGAEVAVDGGRTL
ncbi:MAG: glucose 1-dehydrogenase [Pseudomonadota bacterium]